MSNKKFISKNPALILVDIQKAFLEKDYPGFKRNNPNAEMVSGKILKKWRELKLPIIHVRHSSKNTYSKLHQSKPGFEFKKKQKILQLGGFLRSGRDSNPRPPA